MSANSEPSLPSQIRPPFTGGFAFSWTDGIPQPRGSEAIEKQRADQIIRAAAGIRYRGEWNEDTQQFVMEPRFAGCTMYEVAQIRRMERAASGDAAALKEIDDRLLGKPKQAMESVNVGMSLSEYLDTLPGPDDVPQNEGTYIDVPVHAQRTEALRRLLDEI